eukprot:CAMPEP_0172415040 /NCGR_PEP_ID=MMETSP1064-20121228/1590_1 /TAXON_ID=202472 /ORGANISM="Aulacoseira subarctica , Strain CCAP 1002/5" /LENGTH=66 /DNA_ID=CAMNT_0013151937 /DNA_START=115 /DNA_END=315 /DNA_ORIENTATION=+
MSEQKFKNPFSSGLGKSGRMAAWVVAIAAVGAWSYIGSKDEKPTIFTKEEQDRWNQAKKNETAKQQ